jgi:hypothetical protein
MVVTARHAASMRMALQTFTPIPVLGARAVGPDECQVQRQQGDHNSGEAARDHASNGSGFWAK